MSVIFSNCVECKHFVYTDKGQYLCRAFPEGIPGDYMFRKDQDKNTICNNGIKFAPEELGLL